VGPRRVSQAPQALCSRPTCWKNSSSSWYAQRLCVVQSAAKWPISAHFSIICISVTVHSQYYHRQYSVWVWLHLWLCGLHPTTTSALSTTLTCAEKALACSCIATLALAALSSVWYRSVDSVSWQPHSHLLWPVLRGSCTLANQASSESSGRMRLMSLGCHNTQEFAF